METVPNIPTDKFQQYYKELKILKQDRALRGRFTKSYNRVKTAQVHYAAEQRAEYAAAKRGLSNLESDPVALAQLREYYG